jgi:hypothetical protein
MIRPLGGFEILLLCGESMISQKHRGLFNFSQNLFWTRVNENIIYRGRPKPWNLCARQSEDAEN